MLDDVKLAELSNNSFEWKNVTYYSVKTYSTPSYIFSGGHDPTPRIYAVASGVTTPNVHRLRSARSVSHLSFRKLKLRFTYLFTYLLSKTRAMPTSCAKGRHNMLRPLWSWPLTSWPWKWCPSHMWRGLPLCQFKSSCRLLCSRLSPDVRDRQSERRQRSIIA